MLSYRNIYDNIKSRNIFWVVSPQHTQNANWIHKLHAVERNNNHQSQEGSRCLRCYARNKNPSVRVPQNGKICRAAWRWRRNSNEKSDTKKRNQQSMPETGGFSCSSIVSKHPVPKGKEPWARFAPLVVVKRFRRTGVGSWWSNLLGALVYNEVEPAEQFKGNFINEICTG